MVGGIFGGLIGTYQAVQMRSFLPIPVSIIATGASFGFFMGLGMTYPYHAMNYPIMVKNKSARLVKFFELKNVR